MSITVFTIDTITYNSYASVAEADAYLNIDPVREATWEALTTEEKEKKLIAATRRLDLLDWGGSKTGDADTQANAWPRTGVTYTDGTSVSTSEVPQEVEDATILLAGSIAITAAEADQGTSGSNIKTAKAGSASVTFFRATEGSALQDETAFKLVQQFLAYAQATDSAVGNYFSDEDPARTSEFDDADRYTYDSPLG